MIETTNNIPKHWQLKKLGEVCDKITNGANVKQFDENIGIPISRIETIWNQQIDTNRVKYIKENEKEFIEKYALKYNDILFSHINSDIHLGKTAVYKSVPKTLIHGINLLLIRTNNLVNPIYFNYHLNFLRAKGKFISIAQKSVNQSSINQSKLKNVDIVVPPLPEQQAIVAKIEELLSELENGKQQLLTAQQQLKVYRQSLLKWAFEGKLTNKNVEDGELPKGWKLVKVGDVCKCIVPNRDKPKTFSGNIKWVTTPNLSETSIRLIYNEINLGLSENEAKEYNARVIPVGSVIMTCVGTFGLSAIVEKPIVINQQLHAFISNENVNSKYLAYCIQNSKHFFEKKSTSTTIQYLNKENCNSMPLPLPAMEEQQLIVDELESKLTVCDKIEETITQSLQQAETLKQSILKKAFEGRLINN